MLSIQNVTYSKSYLYQILPRQSVLDEMLLYENVRIFFKKVLATLYLVHHLILALV